MLAIAVTAPARTREVAVPRSPVAYRQITVARALALPSGRVTRAFAFSIRGDFADFVVLDAPVGAVVSVRALPVDGQQIVGATTQARDGECHRRRSRVVCVQGLEWCGLVEGRWRATVRKTSPARAFVRIRLVFVRRVERAASSAL